MSAENENQNIGENLNQVIEITRENKEMENKTEEQKVEENGNEYVNINKIQEEEPKFINPDYYDELGRPRYEEFVNYENNLRAEMELNSPLVSDKLEMEYLTIEYQDSQFENSVKEIAKKYKFIRTVRRDGNCFYRAFIFRLFEELSNNKSSNLYNQILKLAEESKALCEKNDYQWIVFEDFYNVFVSEWKLVYQLDPLNAVEYM